MPNSVMRHLAEIKMPKSGTLLWVGIFVIAFFLAAIFAAKADIQIKRDGPVISVWITDAIKESDAKQLQEISGELEFASNFDVR